MSNPIRETLSTSRVGQPEIILTQQALNFLGQAMIDYASFKAGKMGKSQWAQAKSAHIANMNAIDGVSGIGNFSKQVGSGRISGTRLRPLTYVPEYNSRGKLEIPNSDILSLKMSERGRSGPKVRQGGLMALFGRAHMAILGFVTRDKVGGRSRFNYAPGNMRAFRAGGRRGDTGPRAGTYGYWLGGRTRVAVTRNTTSRIQQAAANGDPKVPSNLYQAVSQVQGFDAVKPPIGPDEVVRQVSRTSANGSQTMAWVVVKSSSVASNAGVSVQRGFKSVAAFQRAQARGRAAGGGSFGPGRSG